jgi:hypothetical protein
MRQLPASLLAINDDDVSAGGVGSTVETEADSLKTGRFDTTFDEVLASGLSAAFREGAGEVFRQAGRGITSDEIPIFLDGRICS